MILLLLLLAQERITQNSGCIECHREFEKEWEGSVHQAEKVSCIECHGTDEVDPRAEGTNKHGKTAEFLPGTNKMKITALCAQCHKAEADAFMQSVHYEKTMHFRSRKVQGCRNCHASHETRKADAKTILLAEKGGCAECHKPDSKEFAPGERYLADRDRLDASVRSLERRIAEPRIGISQAAEALTLEAALRTRRDLPIRQHSCAYGVIGERSEAAATEATAAYNTLQSREESFGKRYAWLAGFLVLLGINAVLLWMRGRGWRSAS